MARKTTRNTRKEIRWDASTGGMIPDFRLSDNAKTELVKISGDERLIPMLENYCGIFLLQDSQEASKPTPGDYDRTLEDLMTVTADFLDRLKKLRGHELEAVIDIAWYKATKNLPEYDALQDMATMFLKQVRVAQNHTPSKQGRTTSTEALRDLISNCKFALVECGLAAQNIDKQTRAIVRICIKSMGKSHLLERLRHYF